MTHFVGITPSLLQRKNMMIFPFNDVNTGKETSNYTVHEKYNYMKISPPKKKDYRKKVRDFGTTNSGRKMNGKQRQKNYTENIFQQKTPNSVT